MYVCMYIYIYTLYIYIYIYLVWVLWKLLEFRIWGKFDSLGVVKLSEFKKNGENE